METTVVIVLVAANWLLTEIICGLADLIDDVRWYWSHRWTWTT